MPVQPLPPDDNPKTRFGVVKPSLSCVPPNFLFEIGAAMSNGAAKYGRFNWREKNVSASVYYDAAMRHLTAWYAREDDNDQAPDSGVHHLAHAAACFCILRDAEAEGSLNDDRPKKKAPRRA